MVSSGKGQEWIKDFSFTVLTVEQRWMVIAMGNATVAVIAATTAINTSYALNKSLDDSWIVVVIYSVALAIAVGIWLGINRRC